MPYRDRAAEIVSQAESALREVIGEALTAQAYRDVATIAGAADQLALVARELLNGPTPVSANSSMQLDRDVAHDQEGSVAFVPHPTGETLRPGGAVVTAKPQRYPYYVRDSERLIKWAWSKKERKPYEHRAPRGIVEVLLDSIRKHKGEGKVFEVSEVMPLKTPRGEEYPSYQAYLALGWLREIGAIRKRGRAGYLLMKGIDAARLETLWNELPQVEERT